MYSRRASRIPSWSRAMSAAFIFAGAIAQLP